MPGNATMARDEMFVCSCGQLQEGNAALKGACQRNMDSLPPLGLQQAQCGAVLHTAAHTIHTFSPCACLSAGNLVRWLLLPPLQSASHSLGQHLGRVSGHTHWLGDVP